MGELQCWMKAFAISLAAALSVGCAGSWLGKNVGVYSGLDWEMKYGHNFGDPKGGGISGTGGEGPGQRVDSSFSIDRADQYPEDYMETGFRILFRPE